MYYVLNRNYLYRGWDMLETGIIRKFAHGEYFLPPKLYGKLIRQDWAVFENSPFLEREEREILDRMVNMGIMELSENIRPLTEEQRYRRYPNRYLSSVMWAVTGKCNCRCRHCYMSAPSGKIPEYSHEKCVEIIEEMEAAGIRFVSLTGGEALVRRDFTDLAERLTKAGIRIIELMSNGLLVTKELLEALEGMGQKPVINMSFDGIGCHDWLRGVDGVEKRVIEAFRLCRDRGFRTASEYCLYKGNLDVFPQSARLLAELGCGELKVNALSPEGEGEKIRDICLSDEEAFRFFLDYLPVYVREGEPMSLMLGGLYASAGKGEYIIPNDKNLPEGEAENYCLCGHARTWMYITPEGYITPCIPIGSRDKSRDLFPNLEKMTLGEALRDSTYMDFINTRLSTYLEMHPECQSCEYKNHCVGGCRGFAVRTGEVMDRDLQACAFYRGGWYEKTLETVRSLGLTRAGEKQ